MHSLAYFLIYLFGVLLGFFIIGASKDASRFGDNYQAIPNYVGEFGISDLIVITISWPISAMIAIPYYLGYWAFHVPFRLGYYIRKDLGNHYKKLKTIWKIHRQRKQEIDFTV